MKPLARLTKQLNKEQRKLLSYAIDDAEFESYWETREWFLRRIQKWLDQGRDVQAEIDYMKNKPAPIRKDR